MVWERLLDLKLNEAFRAGKGMGMFHSASGQEAADVGAGLALREEDAVIPAYRGKAIFLMRGWDLRSLVAGAFGKKEGSGQGRTMTGSHMMGDRSKGLIPMGGPLGGPVATGVGAALALKLQGRPGAVLIWHGDGASSRGDVHESMNFASVLHLPAVFFIVNNGWALSTAASYGVSIKRLSDRAAGYGMRGITVDGSDPVEVHAAVSEALERARREFEPSVVEAVVRRAAPHGINDPDLYRSDGDRVLDREYDPVARFERSLIEKGILKKEDAAEIWREIEERIADAVAYADGCSEPGLEELISGVYETTR